MAATAMIDRLIHNAEILSLTGDNYRSAARHSTCADQIAPTSSAWRSAPSLRSQPAHPCHDLAGWSTFSRRKWGSCQPALNKDSLNELKGARFGRPRGGRPRGVQTGGSRIVMPGQTSCAHRPSTQSAHAPRPPWPVRTNVLMTASSLSGVARRCGQRCRGPRRNRCNAAESQSAPGASPCWRAGRVDAAGHRSPARSARPSSQGGTDARRDRYSETLALSYVASRTIEARSSESAHPPAPDRHPGDDLARPSARMEPRSISRARRWSRITTGRSCSGRDSASVSTASCSAG